MHGNHLLVKSVDAAIKKQVKHVQHKLRNILLTGIVSGSEPELPRIPNIVGFSRLLWRHLNDRNSGITNLEIDMKYCYR
ncbi:hypothetical protein VP01_3228g4 [Puccinia sorghi]|uniref:Uncharacterized protein n=1 Tax=Puccinia sorghi TaxID=27349 RepID=A0A0L6UZ35_9BASI|nr:hypothetical protein VP01_3228g4 [Puccinia sorghi]